MSERAYADDFENSLKDQQRQELFSLIWSYTLALESYVVNLRKQVNVITEQQGLQKPFPDPESDFRIRYFRDLPACQEFSILMEDEQIDIVLPD